MASWWSIAFDGSRAGQTGYLRVMAGDTEVYTEQGDLVLGCDYHTVTTEVAAPAWVDTLPAEPVVQEVVPDIGLGEELVLDGGFGPCTCGRFPSDV